MAEVVRAGAVIFDFNGTLSDDEPVLAAIFVDLAAELGAPITTDDYWRSYAGLSDAEIVDALLARAAVGHNRSALLRERIDRYKALVGPVAPEVAALVRDVAARVPVAVASGAAREEVEHVLGASGLLDAFGAIVCAEDVAHGKPAPDGYRLAFERLAPGCPPGEVLCVEDADAGVQAAHAAGFRCAALRHSPPYTGGADVELNAVTDLRV